jgi:hypothetical protein
MVGGWSVGRLEGTWNLKPSQRGLSARVGGSTAIDMGRRKAMGGTGSGGW